MRLPRSPLPHTRSHLPGVLACLALLACTGEDARVSYSFQEQPGFEVELLILEFSDGTRTRRLTGADFEGGSSRRDTPAFPTRTSGELRTSFWLVQGADTLASGEQRLDLRSDFRWSISFRRAPSDPTVTCLGCAGRSPFALEPILQTSPADSLWVVWAGNSISNPVVF